MANKQMTQEQMAMLKEHQNSEFMRLSYLNQILMNKENGNVYGQGKNLTFNSPILAGAYAQNIVLKFRLNANWDAGTTGTVTPTASYPEGLVSKVEVQYGNKQISANPVLFRILDLMEGYGRTTQDDVRGNRETGIEAMLRKVPTTLVEGDNEIKFEVNISLNNLHSQSINGLIPIFSSGTRLQVGLQLPTVVGKDPLLNVFDVTGDGVLEVTGTIEPIIEFRDYNSMSTVSQVSPDLTGLSTIQIIELPSVTNLSQGQYNYTSFRNPYNFAKMVSFVISGMQSDKFCAADNITGYSLDKQENSNSSFYKYDESTTGIEGWYKSVRARYGNDLPEGVIAWDKTSENISNVSSKTGSSYFNISGSGYTASRQGIKVDEVDNTNIASRIVTYGVLINPQGIQSV